jgi:transcriptional regulator with XRE-family HTH domain
MSRETLSSQLRTAIRTAGVTRYKIARGAGVSQSVVDRFVSGERSLTLGTADKIAHALKLTLAKS